MTTKPYNENEPPISEDRILEILENIFYEEPDQVAIALSILKEVEEEET